MEDMQQRTALERGDGKRREEAATQRRCQDEPGAILAQGSHDTEVENCLLVLQNLSRRTFFRRTNVSQWLNHVVVLRNYKVKIRGARDYDFMQIME